MPYPSSSVPIMLRGWLEEPSLHTERLPSGLWHRQLGGYLVEDVVL